jgi:8-oxo-dGTP pyrophosphatase MutT (NUDIX family)
MPMSPYVRELRAQMGHDLLLLPGVTAIIRNGATFLLARQRGSDLWGTIGGGVEPGEHPEAAVAREVKEELGLDAAVGRVIGTYGGPDLVVEYANGDRVSYVTTAYECELPPTAGLSFADDELVEAAWFTEAEIAVLPRHPWVDRILQDALRDIPAPGRSVVETAVCYVVYSDRLLVFTLDDVPLTIAGLQVPAGTVGDGESAPQAAVREVFEQTGLRADVVRLLGTADYDLAPMRPEVARRHFFQLRLDDADVDGMWSIGDPEPQGGGASRRWTCQWIPLPQAHVLAAGLGVMLGTISPEV